MLNYIKNHVFKYANDVHEYIASKLRMVVVSNVSGYIAIVHACIRMTFYCDVIIYHVNKTYTGSSPVVKGQKNSEKVSNCSN